MEQVSVKIKEQEFVEMKFDLEHLNYNVSDSGRIKVNMKHKRSGKLYHKLLNAEEARRFKFSNEYQTTRVEIKKPKQKTYESKGTGYKTSGDEYFDDAMIWADFTAQNFSWKGGRMVIALAC